MLPVAHVSHRAPGRARIRIPAQRGQEAYFRDAAQRLLRCPGVERVEANPATAGILLVPAPGSDTLRRFAQEQNLFLLTESEAPPMTVTQELAAGFDGLNRQLKAWSGGAVDLGALAFGALVTGAVVQWQKGHVLSSASTLLWYAAGLLLMTRAAAGKDSRFAVSNIPAEDGHERAEKEGNANGHQGRKNRNRKKR
jgi:hypothetical protein